MLSQGQITGELFLHLLWLLMPYAVSWALPMGTLVGILLVMGRLSANNEITAMKASGISLWRIAVPFLCFAMLSALFAVWMNASYAPEARSSYKEIIRNVVRKDPLRFIVAQRFIHDFPGYVFFAGDKEGNALEDLWVWELDEQKRVVRLVRADRGVLAFEPENDGLILTLERAVAELRDEDNPDDLKKIKPTIFIGETSIRFNLSQILGRAEKAEKLSQMPISRKLEKLKTVKGLLIATDSIELKETLRKEQINIQYHIQHGFALGYSVFALALLGIPLGLKASRTETLANVAIALGLAMSYYVFNVVISWQEYSPDMRPDLLIWLPDICFQALGLFLLARANKH